MKGTTSIIFGVVAAVGLATPLAAQNFASTAAVSGHEAFIGEPMNKYAPGAVYVYRMGTGGTWTLATQLTASDAMNYDHFGRSVAADGTTLMVGATAVDSGRGAVYVFTRGGTGAWQQSAKLSAAGIQPGDSLGRVVALSGDLAAVSAAAKDSSSGVVYLFQRTGSGWTSAGQLIADDRAAGDGFGGGLAIADGRVFVGAPQRDSARGGVYVFERDSAGQWQQTGTLRGFGLDPRTEMGSTVLAHGDEIFVAAPGAYRSTGAVMVFTQDSTTGQWREQMRLLPFDARFTQFGAGIAFVGDELWVGGPRADNFTGRVYRFQRDTTGSWTSVTKLGVPNLDRGAGFGGSLAAGADIAVIGLPGADFGQGRAALASRRGDAWSVDTTVWGTDKGLSPIVGRQVDCANGKANIFWCHQVDMESFLPVSAIGGKRGIVVNDMWGWTDGRTGHEYALIGRSDGTAFVDVTDANHPIYVGQLPKTPEANVSVWRDIKVYKDHAFIVSDGAGNHGMQIFDLTRLRNVKNPPVTFTEDAHYTNIHSAHNIVIDTATGYAYIVGASAGGQTCGGGLHMVDIHDPLHPKFVGCFSDPNTGRSGTGYTHDAQCVVYHGPDKNYRNHEICFGSNETALSVADVTDHEHPVAVSHTAYPNVGYTHQGWLTEDQHYFFMDDELDEMEGLVPGTRTLVWDVSDLRDPVLVTEHISKNHAIDHNLYIKGNLMYQSNYLSGLRILDVSNPKDPTDVGFFDTVPVGPDATEFGGSWSNYPFFKSGTIVVTSMEEGIFMLKKHQQTLVQ